MSRVMAVDIGASSYRVIEGIYQGGHLTMKVLERFKHEPIRKGGHYRWDVYEIVQNVVRVIRQAAKTGEAVLSVGFDTFGTDFALIDKNGELAELPLAYRDEISDGMYEKFFQKEKEWYAKTGGTFATTATAHILKGMVENRYKALETAERILFMPDLMAFLFTGEMVNEFTIATTSRLLDMPKRDWDFSFLKELGIPGHLFRPLSEAGSVVGKLKKEISEGIQNLKNTVVTAVACHDTASAVVTIPEMEDCSFISSGTWSVEGIVSDEPYVSEAACRYKMSNEGQPWGRFRLIRNITGLWLVEECVRYWKSVGTEISIPELAREAAQADPFPAMIYTDAPDFAKSGAMPQKIQEYCRKTGQFVPETPVEMMQTIIQGLACEYRRHNEQLAAVTGRKVQNIYIVGGGRNNCYLNQCTANATGCTVTAGHPEATAMGNLLIQLQAQGEIASVKSFAEIAGRDVPAEVYTPERSAEWKEKYEKYLRLCECR